MILSLSKEVTIYQINVKPPREDICFQTFLDFYFNLVHLKENYGNTWNVLYICGRTGQRYTTTCWTELDPCLTLHCGEKQLQGRQNCVKSYLHILLPLSWGWAVRYRDRHLTLHTKLALSSTASPAASSGLGSDQENRVQWDLTAPHMEQTQVYFSHFICIYIHYILILQVVKVIILK